MVTGWGHVSTASNCGLGRNLTLWLARNATNKRQETGKKGVLNVSAMASGVVFSLVWFHHRPTTSQKVPGRVANCDFFFH
jgi:hypothetical protein